MLEVIQLPETFETKSERGAKVVKMIGLVRLAMRDEVNSIPLPRNCVLKVTQLPEELETTARGDTEVAKISALVGVIIRYEVNSILEHRNRAKKKSPSLLRWPGLPG